MTGKMRPICLQTFWKHSSAKRNWMRVFPVKPKSYKIIWKHLHRQTSGGGDVGIGWWKGIGQQLSSNKFCCLKSNTSFIVSMDFLQRGRLTILTIVFESHLMAWDVSLHAFLTWHITGHQVMIWDLRKFHIYRLCIKLAVGVVLSQMSSNSQTKGGQNTKKREPQGMPSFERRVGNEEVSGQVNWDAIATLY